ncbi:RecT family protein [Vibrio phage 1.100.O._10N.261.45.C3]|nr:RecT family protein [Vibrio phage 1.100.O._10N.261.45.C3]
MSTALAKLSDITGATSEEVNEVVKGMIISAKNQHGAQVSNAEMAVVIGTCAKYGLNPLVKECAAFVSGGKLSLVVMIDGYYSIVNRQPNFDGVEFNDSFDDNGKIKSITCRMYLTNRSRPVTVTEYFDECYDAKSSVWRKWGARMLRHKAYIQAARMAFGISEIVDPDEADRIKESEPKQARDITPKTEAVSIEKIEIEIAQAGDLDTLKSICGGIRKDLEARGLWEQHKSTIVKLNEEQKARIASFDDVEEAEFEEVVEDVAPIEEPDIAFEDDEEEF